MTNREQPRDNYNTYNYNYNYICHNSLYFFSIGRRGTGTWKWGLTN